MTTAAQRIEALLFLSGDYVSRQELSRLISCPTSQVDKYLSEISDNLSASGLSLVATNTHVQLVTAPLVADFIKKFVANESADLTPAVAETLSIIAYRGPIDRPSIDLIRGIDSHRLVRQLLSRNLITKKNSQRRLTNYVITTEFLVSLGLTKISDLPDYEKLSSSDKVERLLEISG